MQRALSVLLMAEGHMEAEKASSLWESAPGLFSGTEKVFAIKIGPPARPGVDVGIVS